MHGPHRDVHALWSNEHALAWHLGDDFRADPVAWAQAQCLAWVELEDQLPNFLEDLPDCPCTLAQARADSGRFHVSHPPQSGPRHRGGSRWGQLRTAAPPRTALGEADRGPWETSAPEALAPREGMAAPETGTGDSNLPLCRRTMAAMWSMAACAPTTQGLCTVYAPCKPGEPRDGRQGSGRGWGQDPKRGPGLFPPPDPSSPLTHALSQPPVCLRPAVLLHRGRHPAADGRLHQWKHPGPRPRLGSAPIPDTAPCAWPLPLALRRHQFLPLLPLGARVLPLHESASLQ